MAQINPDYSEAGGLDEGTYRARVVECKERHAKESGNPYMSWKLETIHSEKRFNKQILYYNTPYTGKAAGMFRDVVRATIDPNYHAGPVDPETAVGREVAVVVEKDLKSPWPKVTAVQTVDHAPAVEHPADGDVPF